MTIYPHCIGVAAHSTVRATTLLPSCALREMPVQALESGEAVTYGQTATNRYIGYLPDVPEFYPYMTAEDQKTVIDAVLEAL